MKTTIKIYIEYHLPDPTEELYLIGEIRYQNGLTATIGNRLTRIQPKGQWYGEIHIEHNISVMLYYNYRISYQHRIVRNEPPVPHTLVLTPKGDNDSQQITLRDRWLLSNPEHLLDTTPLATLLGSEEQNPLSHLEVCTGEQVIVFRPSHYESVSRYYITGESEQLGAWDPERAIPMRYTLDGYATTIVSPPTSYKIIRKQADQVEWESGENRSFVPVWGGTQIQYIEAPHLEKVKVPRAQFKGVVLPLFSLRTQRSYGCGDLSDAIAFLEVIERAGLQVYQLLPIYDTTHTRGDSDSYPYNSITTYGLHPIYLDVRQLPGYESAPEREAWEQEAARLNALSKVDYSQTMALKERVYTTLIDRYIDSEIEEDKAFHTFVEKEYEQLMPYALFSVIRDRETQRSVSSYPSYEDSLHEWIERHSLEGIECTQEVTRYLYLQYRLYAQLEALTTEATQRGIILKGDLPIGVGRESVDVWVDPELFHLDKEAGAPPDGFSLLGQNWTFPTYDWEMMAHEGYEWWQTRLKTMSRYFGAVRIDHILGFFRIWSIPFGEINPCVGHFVPALGYSRAEIEERITTETIEELTTPLLSEKQLKEVWGAHLSQAKGEQLIHQYHDGRWTLTMKHRDEIPAELWPAYQRMRGEVLFVTDDEGALHPRVMLHQTLRFQALLPEIQERLGQLHEEFYYHRNEELWRECAVTRLTGIREEVAMLFCAEDLGMLPHSVSSVLSDLEMLSLEIIRMPKKVGIPFVRPENIGYGAVVSTSTHDMASLRGWWEGLTNEEKELLMTLYAPAQTTAPTMSALIRGLCHSAAMLTILPLQDWCTLTGYGAEVPAQEEQINKPEVTGHTWNYRMYGTVEELLQEGELLEQIREV